MYRTCFRNFEGDNNDGKSATDSRSKGQKPFTARQMALLCSGSRNFTTVNGPNVHVYFVDANDAKDNESVRRGNIIDLGPIKGNIGDQKLSK